MECRICSNITGNISFVAREMMYGLRDQFEYFLCSQCECIQIKEYPSDMIKYYPKNYYSFAKLNQKKSNFITDYFRLQRARYCINGVGILGKFVAKLMPNPLMFDLLRKCEVDFHSSILDIGSGTGSFLSDLKRIGFTNLTGIDPYVSEDINYEDGIKIIKGHPAELKTQFDLIVMKDSLEHMPNQYEIFMQVQNLLKPRSHALIIIPVVGYSWRLYGANWVGLDAPRHFYLHSLKSLKILTKKTNLEVVHVIYDSNEDQFIGSEQYARNISMFDPKSYYVDRKRSIFSKRQIANYRKEAMQLNSLKDGDRVCIILNKVK